MNKEQALRVKEDEAGQELLSYSLAQQLECLTHSECHSTLHSGTSQAIYKAYLALRRESAIFKLLSAYRGPHSRCLNMSFRRWKEAPANPKEPRNSLFIAIAHPRIDNWYIRRPSVSSFGSDPSVGESVALEDTPRVSPKPTPFPSIYQRIYEETISKKQSATMRTQIDKDTENSEGREESGSFTALMMKKIGKRQPVHIRTQLRRPAEDTLDEEQTISQPPILTRPPSTNPNPSKSRLLSPSTTRKRKMNAVTVVRPMSQPRGGGKKSGGRSRTKGGVT